ncbi:ParB/RepB/Spo0J family partition protein [Sphingomonas sp. UYP23]
MNDMTAFAKTRAKRAAKITKVEIVPSEAIATPIAATIVPSAPQPIALGRLRRAPENVRHKRMDEDVQALADDIAAHGLLTSLIGYLSEWPEDQAKVYIVGGGRRLQAMQELATRGAIGDEFPVPVLIRDQEDAIELSLSENLGHRTMSPVDECFGFKALMDRGNTSPTELAKRFGYSERVVRQRLRLAELAPVIIDALAERSITLDAAMAYATTQDATAQAEVFKRQSKTPYRPHDPERIRWDLRAKTIKTSHPLYLFVGAAAYERRGGRYEDDLFAEQGTERTLVDTAALETLAHEQIDFQMIRRLPEMAAEFECETVAGFVKLQDLVYPPYGLDPKAPTGLAWVAHQYDPGAAARMWKTARNNRIPVHVLVGIDTKGELAPYAKGFFVPKEHKEAVQPTVQPPAPAAAMSPEDYAAARREQEIRLLAFRKAAGPFVGTHLEGRAFWPRAGWNINPLEKPIASVPGLPEGGKLVALQIYVTEAQMDAHLEEAADEHAAAELARSDAAIAAEAAAAENAAALEARATTLEAMEPPAVVVIDGEPWARDDAGAYSVIGEESESYVETWLGLLANFDTADVDATYATREEFDAAIGAAVAANGDAV